jgi:hypothetical protein
MDRKPYYVSVQAGTILENRGDAGYEMEISATPEDIAKLSEIFETMADFDQASFFRANALAYPYHLDAENDGYDYYLREAYRLIYELGSPETKQHIERAGLANLNPNNG